MQGFTPKVGFLRMLQHAAVGRLIRPLLAAMNGVGHAYQLWRTDSYPISRCLEITIRKAGSVKMNRRCKHLKCQIKVLLCRAQGTALRLQRLEGGQDRLLSGSRREELHEYKPLGLRSGPD